MGDIDGGLEALPGVIVPPGKPGEEHRGCARLAKHLGRAVALVVPEGIQNAHQGGALAGEVGEAEQLEAAHVRGAQGGFDLFPIAEHLEAAGSFEKLTRLGGHAPFFQELPEQIEIARLEGPGVLGDFIEVGEGAPLADFMAHHRGPSFGEGGADLPVVGGGFRGQGVDPGIQTFAPSLHPGFVDVVEVVFRDRGPAGAGGVEAAAVSLFPVGYPLPEELIDSSGGFVSRAEHHEGGMVPVGGDDAFGFPVEPLVQSGIGAHGGALVGPHRAFHLEVDALFVRGVEGGFGGAPGVKADVVEAVFPGPAVHPAP